MKKSKNSNHKEISLDDLAAYVVLLFCENAKALGCPPEEKNPCAWVCRLSDSRLRALGKRIFDLHIRNAYPDISEVIPKPIRKIVIASDP